MGYPQEPSEIIYSAPILRDYDITEYTGKIYEAFHNFGKKLTSSGTVLHQSAVNCALVADYSSTSGQSGGPVYRIKNSQCELVGVNVGGATQLCHWILGQIISSITKRNWDRANTLLSRVRQELEDNETFYL